MYSSAEDLLRWNQALSATNFFPESIRHAMFSPGLRNWADGWFVTRIPPNRPGAGSLLAEMRGDMPGNFFTWILRYPEQNTVVIVLRNGYGSTEHLEENLQAVLFGQTPHLPRRSPKDLIAHSWQLAWAWPANHPWPAGFAFVGLAAVLAIRTVRRGKRSKSDLQLATCSPASVISDQ
jgi:hypothetical protein